MSAEVRLWARVLAHRSEVYRSLCDPAELVSIVDGLRELHALRPDESVGEGSEFTAVMHLGPQEFAEKLTLSRLVLDERVVWRSKDDGGRELSFTLSDGEAGETKVLLVVSYLPPDGLKGAVLAPLIGQAVRVAARRTLVQLKERFGAPQGGSSDAATG